MNWYKIRAQDEAGEGYTYVGASPLTADAIAELASQGKFIRLDESAASECSAVQRIKKVARSRDPNRLLDEPGHGGAGPATENMFLEYAISAAWHERLS